MNTKKETIYGDVAFKAIKNWYLWDKDEKDAEMIAETIVDKCKLVNFETIEKGSAVFEEVAKFFNDSNLSDLKYGIGALNSIVSGLTIIDEKCDRSITENDDLVRKNLLTISGNKEIEEELKKAGERFKDINKNCIEKATANLVLDVLEKVHDRWVIDNTPKKFMQDSRKNKQYMHLPFECIGWKDVCLDLLFVEKMLEKTGLEINLEKIQEEYGKRQEEKFKEIYIDGLKTVETRYLESLNIDKERLKMTLSELENKDTLVNLYNLTQEKCNFSLPRGTFPEINERVRKALEMTGKVQSGEKSYLAKVLEQRLDGPTNAGSSYKEEDIEALYRKIEKADYMPVTDKEVLKNIAPGCTVFKTNLPGFLQVNDLDSLPDDATFYVTDVKDTGCFGIGSGSVKKERVNETYIILGNEEIDGKNEEIVYTFHPGKPTTASKQTVKETSEKLGRVIKNGSRLTKEEVKELGFSKVKFLSNEYIKQFDAMNNEDINI